MLVFVLCSAGGFACWPAMEYFVHGILSHRLRTFVSPLHWVHHVDERRVRTSPSAWVPAAAAIFGLLALVAGAAASGAFVGGLVAGFLRYEHVHWRIHFREPGSERERRRRLHHLSHHYVNPHAYHGVTTRLFDRLFGTLPPGHAADYERVSAIPVLGRLS
ncbi:MAG: sterol desaturase family protein [Acidobacteriota bacterium]